MHFFVFDLVAIHKEYSEWLKSIITTERKTEFAKTTEGTDIFVKSYKEVTKKFWYKLPSMF